LLYSAEDLALSVGGGHIPGDRLWLVSGRGGQVVTTEEFERMYEMYYDAVLRYCLRRSRPQDALDAAAETFAVAWRRREDLSEQQRVPWLYATARRVLANQRRGVVRQVRAARRMHSERNHNPGPETQLVRRAEEQEVLAAVERLRPDDREIIRLAGWEELPREDIAVAMRCSPNAVTKRLNRALDHLAAEMGTRRRPGSRFFHREGSRA
jgi:RNA polymerase sigma-70 factor (ECF subfamily)